MKCWARAAQAGFDIPQVSSAEQERLFPGTSCKVLDGQLVAQKLLTQCRVLAQRNGTPNLGVILAGEDPASKVYVGNKIRVFAEAGFESRSIVLPTAEATPAALARSVADLNDDRSVHGILVQLPLPKGIDATGIVRAIRHEKDVDGFLPLNMGLLASGDFSGSIACTPFGVMALLRAYNIPLAGRHAVVVGRSQTVGRPMSFLLLGENCTVTIAHSQTRDLAAVCRTADILIAAAGQPALIQPDFVKPGATVVDVGIHRGGDGKLCGDVSRSVADVASYLSPVPKGVGPMTIAMLCVNTALAAWTK